MRILNIIASIDPASGGPTIGTLGLTAAWREDGHDVEIASLDSPAAPYLETVESVHALGTLGVAHAASRHFRDRFGYSKAMIPWLKANVARFDLVVVHGLWNYSTVAAARALIGSTTPYVVFPHGTLDPWFASAYPLKHAVKRALWPFNEGALLNGARRVLFTTAEERDLAGGQFRPWRIRAAVVGFGSDDAPCDRPTQHAAFLERMPQLADRPYLLFLSRIHEKKGCDLLVRAFAHAALGHPDLHLVIAGPDQTGWQDHLQALARSLGVAERIHWPGMITGTAKWGAFRLAEAFVLPSHSENFGIVVAEALACAKPVLITDKVNLWREVAAVGAGLVEPDTQSGIDTLLDRFLALGKPARETMEHAARRCYEQNFRFAATARNVIFAAVGDGVETAGDNDDP